MLNDNKYSVEENRADDYPEKNRLLLIITSQNLIEGK